MGLCKEPHVVVLVVPKRSALEASEGWRKGMRKEKEGAMENDEKEEEEESKAEQFVVESV